MTADREIILSAGALDSPKLLMLSGVGPADTLRELGIDVVKDLPGVGRNLQEHTGGKLMARTASSDSLFDAESVRHILRYLVTRRGKLACNGPEAVAFVRTRADLPAPDIEILLFPAIWLNEGFTPPPEHGYSVAVVLLKPKSRGWVTLKSTDPHDAPSINMCLFSDADGQDMRTVLEGLRIARRILSQPAFNAFGSEELYPGPRVTSDVDLAGSVRAEAQTIWHPIGTCSMGTTAMSVVDSELRVHGVERLRVIDASVMPTITRGHTHAPAMMIGEKGADLVLGKTIH